MSEAEEVAKAIYADFVKHALNGSYFDAYDFVRTTLPDESYEVRRNVLSELFALNKRAKQPTTEQPTQKDQQWGTW